MKSLSVCVIFFLVLFTISGDCRVAVNEDRHSLEIQWQCIPSTCESLCKAQEGIAATGYCNEDKLLGCYCKNQQSGYETPWQCVLATCDKLCKAQQGTAATGLCKGLYGCFCKTNTAGC